MTIKITRNGRPFSGGLEDLVKDGIQEIVRKEMEKKKREIEHLRCPDHDTSPKVSIVRKDAKTFNLTTDPLCCDKLEEMVNNVVRK